MLLKERKINSRLGYYEKPDVLKLAAAMEKKLGGVNELLLHTIDRRIFAFTGT